MKDKRFPAIALLISALALTGAHAADREDRAPPRPKVLFVFAPDTQNKALQSEYEQLQRAGNALDDSDIETVFVIGDRSVKLPPPDSRTEEAANLRKLYHVDADAFRMVLIGKDGWQKMRWSEPVDPGQVMAHAGEMPTKKDKDQDQK